MKRVQKRKGFSGMSIIIMQHQSGLQCFIIIMNIKLMFSCLNMAWILDKHSFCGLNSLMYWSDRITFINGHFDFSKHNEQYSRDIGFHKYYQIVWACIGSGSPIRHETSTPRRLKGYTLCPNLWTTTWPLIRIYNLLFDYLVRWNGESRYE